MFLSWTLEALDTHMEQAHNGSVKKIVNLKGLLKSPSTYDIDVGLDKTVPRHFEATNSGKENLVVTPIMKVRSRNPWVRLHLERNLINRYNLIEEGLNECL